MPKPGKPESRKTKRLLCKGNEATVYRFPAVSVKGKKFRSRKRDVVRRMPSIGLSESQAGRNPFMNFYQFKIANLLFPGLFLKVSRARTRKDGSFEMFSRYVDSSRDYQDFLEKYYPTGGRKCFELKIAGRHYKFPEILRDHPHFLKAKQFAESVAPKLHAAGIYANLHPVNMGEGKDGKFVFFEIFRINASKLEGFAKKLPEEDASQQRKKSKLLGLLRLLTLGGLRGRGVPEEPWKKQKKRKLLRLIARYKKHKENS